MNGKEDAIAGIGVNYCDGLPGSFNERLPPSDIPHTSQRAEIMAAIRLLERDKSEKLAVYSDSLYLVQARNEWHHKWKETKYSGIKNKDLWFRLEKLVAGRDVSFTHVRGHVGNTENEIAHKLAASTLEKDFIPTL